MRSVVRIGSRKVGRGRPAFIVAEVGINHNGEVERAREMIRAAAACGVDAVKFQTFQAEEFVGDPTLTYTYTSQGSPVTESMRALFKRHELAFGALGDLKAEADRCGVLFFSTPSGERAMQCLLEVGVPCVKVGSDDLTHLALLRELARFRLPMVLSTGMATEAEVREAIRVVRQARNSQIILLHCVSIYPTPDLACNLRRIESLRRRFPYPVGYSDHSEGIDAARLAVSLGAVMIEKHFTLDKNLSGPDHHFSADPAEMAALVREVRRAERMLGAGRIAPGPEEREMKRLCRRSIVARVPIEPGTVIGREMLALKRPGTGLAPADLKKVVGRRARRSLGPDQPLTLSDLA